VNRVSGWTRVALILGAAVSPIFFLVVFIQAATRPGYSLNRVPLSLLSLGDAGWVQITNFVICGVLALVGAIGIRRALAGQRGRAALTVLSAIFGLGLIVAGVFHPDPAAGFPPGVSAPAVTSTHNAIHETGFLLVNVSLWSVASYSQASSGGGINAAGRGTRLRRVSSGSFSWSAE
jgi:hypothetical protein